MVYPAACERARLSASLRLDAELSELEAAHLDAHLARCAGCAAAVAAIEAATGMVRAAPLEPVRVAPAKRPARQRQSLRPFFVAAAAMVVGVSAVTGVASIGAVHVVAQSAQPVKLQHVSGVASGLMSDDVELLAHVRVLRNERRVGGGMLWPT
jgi:anti-sigma factor RsiW